jgi:hypothetical protein
VRLPFSSENFNGRAENFNASGQRIIEGVFILLDIFEFIFQDSLEAKRRGNFFLEKLARGCLERDGA